MAMRTPKRGGLGALRLRKLVRYDSRTGKFFWRVGGFKRRKGLEIGTVSKRLGYRLIGLERKRYYAHELAWLYVYGRFPDGRLEFINGNGLDVRIKNLREHKSGLRLEETKVCPVCSNVFSRDGRFSNKQWDERLFCSRKCGAEHRRRAAAVGLKCRVCGCRGPFAAYATKSGRVSRRNICRRCFNRRRRPKRRARERAAKALGPALYLYSRIKANAKQRGTPLDMTFGQFLAEIGGDVPKTCAVFGIDLDLLAPRRSPQLPTIDRIDSAKPYEAGNIAVISWRANELKRNGTAEEHRRIADWMDAIATRCTKQKTRTPTPAGRSGSLL